MGKNINTIALVSNAIPKIIALQINNEYLIFPRSLNEYNNKKKNKMVWMFFAWIIIQTGVLFSAISPSTFSWGGLSRTW